MAESIDKFCLEIHCGRSSDSSSDDEELSDFDETHSNNRPGPVNISPDKLVVIAPPNKAGIPVLENADNQTWKTRRKRRKKKSSQKPSLPFNSHVNVSLVNNSIIHGESSSGGILEEFPERSRNIYSCLPDEQSVEEVSNFRGNLSSGSPETDAYFDNPSAHQLSSKNVDRKMDKKKIPDRKLVGDGNKFFTNDISGNLPNDEEHRVGNVPFSSTNIEKDLGGSWNSIGDHSSSSINFNKHTLMNKTKGKKNNTPLVSSSNNDRKLFGEVNLSSANEPKHLSSKDCKKPGVESVENIPPLDWRTRTVSSGNSDPSSSNKGEVYDQSISLSIDLSSANKPKHLNSKDCKKPGVESVENIPPLDWRTRTVSSGNSNLPSSNNGEVKGHISSANKSQHLSSKNKKPGVESVENIPPLDPSSANKPKYLSSKDCKKPGVKSVENIPPLDLRKRSLSNGNSGASSSNNGEVNGHLSSANKLKYLSSKDCKKPGAESVENIPPLDLSSANKPEQLSSKDRKKPGVKSIENTPPLDWREENKTLSNKNSDPSSSNNGELIKRRTRKKKQAKTLPIYSSNKNWNTYDYHYNDDMYPGLVSDDGLLQDGLLQDGLLQNYDELSLLLSYINAENYSSQNYNSDYGHVKSSNFFGYNNIDLPPPYEPPYYPPNDPNKGLSKKKIVIPILLALACYWLYKKGKVQEVKKLLESVPPLIQKQTSFLINYAQAFMGLSARRDFQKFCENIEEFIVARPAVMNFVQTVAGASMNLLRTCQNYGQLVVARPETQQVTGYVLNLCSKLRKLF